MSCDLFRVVDFEKLQHYRDRAPPWIKLYNGLLEDYAFARLGDAAKAHLISIWLLASRSDNCLPMDALWLARRINAQEPVDLEILRQAGFIEPWTASKPLARRKQKARPERETETEREAERKTEHKTLSDPRNADADDDCFFASQEKEDSEQNGTARKTYPDAFEAFWRDYPTDPVMSKFRAFARWRVLNDDDRAAAHAALAPFRDHCRRHPTYHPVHAERFLSQRRFDGFADTPRAADAPLKAMWGGAAAPLVEEIGAAAFQAYFGDAVYEPGPPVRIRITRPLHRELAQRKFAAALKRAFGGVEGEVCLVGDQQNGPGDRFEHRTPEAQAKGRVSNQTPIPMPIKDSVP